MSDIREAVAVAICKDLWAKGLIDMSLPPETFLIPATVTADAAITAFLEAAAKEGWHMRPDEPTAAMKGIGYEAWSRGTAAHCVYRIMLEAAPEFKLDS